MKYAFDYDYFNKMWIFKELDINLKIYITKWYNTPKGPMVDIAIFDNEDSDIFYDIEIFTKSLTAEQIPEYCSKIVDLYKRGGKFFGINLIRIFPKCKVNAYCRKGQGNNSELLKYAVKSYNIFGKAKEFYYKANGNIEKTWPRPALEYPGSRLDSIAY